MAAKMNPGAQASATGARMTPSRPAGLIRTIAQRGAQRQRKRRAQHACDDDRPPPPAASLSEIAWCHAIAGRRPRGSWRDTHGVDLALRCKFAEAADLMALAHRGRRPLNGFLTIKDGQARDKVLKRLRKLYASKNQHFHGFWRVEAEGGLHFHILFHLPRGMRALLMELLPRWLEDPLDSLRSSPRFDRRQWRVVGQNRSYDLRRVHDLDGVLDYLAKRPLNDAPRCLPKHARAFGVFGQAGLASIDDGAKPCRGACAALGV